MRHSEPRRCYTDDSGSVAVHQVRLPDDAWIAREGALQEFVCNDRHEGRIALVVIWHEQTACCRREGIYLVEGDDPADYEMKEPIPHERLELLFWVNVKFLGWQLPHKRNGDCIYLEGGRCSIWDRTITGSPWTRRCGCSRTQALRSAPRAGRAMRHG